MKRKVERKCRRTRAGERLSHNPPERERKTPRCYRAASVFSSDSAEKPLGVWRCYSRQNGKRRKPVCGMPASQAAGDCIELRATRPHGLPKTGRALPVQEGEHGRKIPGQPRLSAFSSITPVEPRCLRIRGLQVAFTASGLLAVFPAHIASQKKGQGTGTPRDLHVLCYQHHREMLTRGQSGTGTPAVYVCKEPGCLVCYDALGGYFLDTEDPKIVEQELKPRTRCSKDGRFMYLAEVRPEQRSFRLWRCPECEASYSHQESERKAGA